MIAHVPTAAEAARLPAGLADALIVDRTIKGLETRHYLPHLADPNQNLAPGQSVLLLMPFVETRYDLLDRPPRYFEKVSPAEWPIDRDMVDTRGVPLNSEDGRLAGVQKSTGIGLATVLGMLADAAPEEVDLQGQMLDCLLFPDRFAALEKKDPDRSAYVRLACVARDLARDVPALANLLESPDGAMRAAVAKISAFDHRRGHCLAGQGRSRLAVRLRAGMAGLVERQPAIAGMAGGAIRLRQSGRQGSAVFGAADPGRSENPRGGAAAAGRGRGTGGRSRQAGCIGTGPGFSGVSR
ncbi:MAG TPA: hypothetical protein VHY37_00550 [Tepidisphaeraceae bacterium]|jgi:hypothetical protein|nr:hypothetical protein [Tepidisphaeraceae bacterium]